MTQEILDSRSETHGLASSSYASSESDDTRYWGQPPASHYVFVIRGNIITGVPLTSVYAQIRDIAAPGGLDHSFQAEINTWERASDIDLASFERSLE